MTTMAIRQFGTKAVRMPLIQGFVGALLAAAILYGVTIAYGAARWRVYGKNEQRISNLEQTQNQIIAYLQQHATGGK